VFCKSLILLDGKAGKPKALPVLVTKPARFEGLRFAFQAKVGVLSFMLNGRVRFVGRTPWAPPDEGRPPAGLVPGS
jgi:hypothetical protein